MPSTAIYCTPGGALYAVQMCSIIPALRHAVFSFCAGKIRHAGCEVVKIRMVLPFWCQLNQVVLAKRLLNGCSSSSSSSSERNLFNLLLIILFSS